MKKQTIYYVHLQGDKAEILASTAKLTSAYIVLAGGKETGWHDRIGYREMERQGFGWTEEEAVQSLVAKHESSIIHLKRELTFHKRKLEVVRTLADKYGYGQEVA